jgi:hypothetical protein
MKNDKYYSYIFLRKDLIPEQVAIQAAHVSMLVAVNAMDDKPWVDYNKLNFVMTPLSVAPIELEKYLDDLGHSVESFYDKLYYFDETGNLCYGEEDVVTAMMTFPIHEDNRGILKMLPLYRMKR